METQPGCLSDGDLRALVDDAVPGSVRSEWTRHVDLCAECQQRMAIIAEDAGAVAAYLHSIRLPMDTIDENEALKRVHSRRVAREPASALLKGDSLMNRLSGVGRRGAIAGVAVVALMVAIIAAVPFSSLAEDMLTRFRVQQFSAITIPMDLFQHDAQASGSSDGTMNAFVAAQLSELGKLNTTLNRNSLNKAASMTEAQAHLDNSLQVPANLASFDGVQPTVYLTDAGTVTYDLNVQKARDLFQLGGIDTAPLPDPATMPTAKISLDVPAGAALDYVSNGKHLVVAQMESPTLSIPSSIDMSMVRDELLALGVLPPDTVTQLRAINDWEHTLIIPVPSGATSSNVTVQGSPGLLITSDQGSAVLWQKNGVLHAVGSDSNVDVMSIASSLH